MTHAGAQKEGNGGAGLPAPESGLEDRGGKLVTLVAGLRKNWCEHLQHRKSIPPEEARDALGGLQALEELVANFSCPLCNTLHDEASGLVAPELVLDETRRKALRSIQIHSGGLGAPSGGGRAIVLTLLAGVAAMVPVFVLAPGAATATNETSPVASSARTSKRRTHPP